MKGGITELEKASELAFCLGNFCADQRTCFSPRFVIPFLEQKNIWFPLHYKLVKCMQVFFFCGVYAFTFF